MKRHPSELQLALWAGGDLGWLAAANVRWHVSGCPECRRSVAEFRECRRVLAEAGAPRLNDWSKLAAEMEANIHVGLEAGECVEPKITRRAFPARWKLAAACAAFLVVVGGLIWLPGPSAWTPAQGVDGAVFSAGGHLIQLEQDGRALGLRHEGAQDVTYRAAANGAVEARYIDEDTGQVTVQNVVFHE